MSKSEIEDEYDELAGVIAEAVRRRPSVAEGLDDIAERQRLLSDLIGIRKSMGLTQKQVAERMQTTQSAVSDLETGAVDPHFSTLQRFARAVSAKIHTKVDLPHDSSWQGARMYERKTSAMTVNRECPPGPLAERERAWSNKVSASIHEARQPSAVASKSGK